MDIRFQNRRMKWKKDNKLPNTKNVKKKNADGSVQVTPGTGKKGKRGASKKQQQQATTQSEVKMEMFKDDDFHALLWISQCTFSICAAHIRPGLMIMTNLTFTLHILFIIISVNYKKTQPNSKILYMYVFMITTKMQ